MNVVTQSLLRNWLQTHILITIIYSKVIYTQNLYTSNSKKMQPIHIYIEEYTGDARPPTRRTTRNAARRARRRIQRALRAEQELQEMLQLAVMEQQAAEYARFQRLQEIEERRREEEKKEEAERFGEEVVDKLENEQIFISGLNEAPKDQECSICFERYKFVKYDGASMCSKSDHWICYTCYKNLLVEAYIKASTNTFAVPCPYCRQERLFNKNDF